MKALGIFVILEKVKEKKTTIGALKLTETQSDDLKFQKGRVVSFGSKVNELTNDNEEKLKVGDLVKYDKNAAKFDELDGKSYYVVRADSIAYVI